MNVLYGIFIMLCIHNSVHGHRLTAISEITPKLIKTPGSTAYLTCTVFNPMKFNISWVMVDKESHSKTILSFGKTLLFKNPRFSLRQDIISTKHFDSNCYTLQILNIRVNDAGVYSCHVWVQTNDTISADTEIDVQIPPTIINATRSLIIRKGQPLKLECYADGLPMPTVTWRRQGGAILVTGESVHRGNVLEFRAINKADRGFYYCRAENKNGKIIRHNVEVVVEFSPFVTTPKPFRGQSLTYFVDLDCHIEAHPMPSVIWLHKGVELFNNQYIIITNIASSETVIDSKLRIHLIEKQQYGDYICKAFNILGTDEVTINIHHTLKPMCPPACN